MKKSPLSKAQRAISTPRGFLTVLSMILLISCFGPPKEADDEAIERFKQWFRDFYLAVENHTDLEPYVEVYYIDWYSFGNKPNYNPYYDLYDVDHDSDLVMYRAGGREEFLRAMEWFNTNFGLPEDITIYEATYRKRAYPTGYYAFELEVHRQFANTKEEYVFGYTDGEFKVQVITFVEAKLDNEDKVPVDKP